MSATSPHDAGRAVLHLAPHPDDECIGAPASLMALRDAGWRVVNLACSLGGQGESDRRRHELDEACRRAGFVSEVVDDPLGDPLGAGAVSEAVARLAAAVQQAIAQFRPELVVAPSPHDRHRGHEVVGRAALRALSHDSAPPQRVWLWGLWADLPFPSLAVGFDETRLAEILHALDAHGGELARNDYRRLVRGRAEMNASVGPERVFGFGSGASRWPYVELLSELGPQDDGWRLGEPRWLDASVPFGRLGARADEWLSAPSVTERFGLPGDDAPG